MIINLYINYIMENNDLYNILELSNDATLIDIKRNFKRLALKYHPDKNIQNNINYNEKFNQIRIAYEILSNKEKKLKYDQMNIQKKHNFIDTIFQFLKKITDPQVIHNIMLRPDITDAIKDGNINKIAQKLIQKILDNIDLNIDMEKLEEVFIHTPTKQNININTSESNILSISDINTLNIIGNINVNLEDVYFNRLKEIIIKRKVYKQNEIINHETLKYNIPLYDNKVVISNAGDKSINDKSEIEYGNVILKIKYINNNNLIKNNYNIIYNSTITLYELFYGFNKQINYFNTTIDICSDNPLNEYSFNGKYISINIKNKGIPYDQENNRGDLIIYLYLKKTDDFKSKLSNNFNV
jgi:DnaJ-class molecular chaperone